MASKKAKEYWTYVKDEDHFNQFYNENNKKLVVCEIYPTWSGPCNLMFNTYKSLALNIDDFDKRIDILLVKSEIIEENVNKNLKK
mmetsp:Transcript_2689/g.364  ORF Transcript_2689/g.364 Transcript_2689/m.364 type:complete len:85 (+) Transcript_2689:55-309(+)